MLEQEVSPVVRPTLCEVTYHTEPEDVQEWEDVYTPYRYRGLSTQESPSGYGTLYYDPTTVGCRTPHSFTHPANRNVPMQSQVYQGPNNRTMTAFSMYSTHGTSPSRACTMPIGAYYCTPNQAYAYSPVHNTAGHRNDRAKTAPCTGKSLPVLLLQRQAAESRMSGFNRAMTSMHLHGDVESERLKWVPALNTWVSQNEHQNPAPYTSFVSSLNPGRGRGGGLEIEGHELPVLPCSRFLSHMHMHDEQLKGLHTEKSVRLENQRHKRDKRTTHASSHKHIIPQTDEQKPTRLAVYRPPPRPPKQTSTAPPVTNQKPPSPQHSSPTPPSEPVQTNDNVDDNALDDEDERMMLTKNDADESDEVQIEKDHDPSAVSSPVPPSIPSQPPSEPSTPPVPSSPPDNQAHSPVPVPPEPTESTQPSKTSKSKSSKTITKLNIAQSSSKKAKGSKKKDTESSKQRKTKDSGQKKELHKLDIPETVAPPVGLVLRQDSMPESPDIPEYPISESVTNQSPTNPKEKRVRWRAQHQKDSRDSDETDRENSASWKRKEAGWLFGDDDYSTTLVQEDTTEDVQQNEISPPPLPEIKPSTPTDTPEPPKRPDLPKVIPDWAKKKYGRKKRDESWEEEQRRKRLAQERRDKALEMYERLRRKRYADDEDDLDLSDGPRFEDYGWLAQYCIFQRNNLELFKRTFEVVDEDQKGYLGPIDTIVALRAINNKLSLTEEEYLYRILELAGYKISSGSDFKLYAIMAALSQRISSLDDWMKHLIGNMDFSTLERKMFMCKTLWECNVDRDTNTISIDQLCVELRAGGVSYEHETEVRDKLGHLGSLDLLDFMTYIPLFIMIHESVVDNPLDDSRVK